jgi:hypothetical protein
MRGSAQPVSDMSSPVALRAARQGDFPSPVHPQDQEAAQPLIGSPTSEPVGSVTSRPLARHGRAHLRGARAHGALLPETPARKELHPLSALSPAGPVLP